MNNNQETFAQILKATNWNSPTHEFYNELFLKILQQFWVPDEIPVSKDKIIWDELDPKIKQAYERTLAGLTLLDTNQTMGIVKVGEKSNNQFIEAILALIAGYEAIHARSYSNIFQTLCTPKHIDELFNWVEQTKELQTKVHRIIKTYNRDEPLFMSYVGSLCLEGICFYSGFFLPLYLSGQGKMVNSGEIINLILRDEKLHTVGVGFFAQQELAQMTPELQEHYKQQAYKMIEEIYQSELVYSHLLYDDLGLFDEVKTYIEFNVNYALSCLGFEPMFEVTENDVNPVVMNGYSIETKTHDFFSTKGNGYIKNTNVEPLQDEDFIFN